MVLDNVDDDDSAATAAAATVVDTSSELTVDADSDIKSFIPAPSDSVMMSSDTTTPSPPLLVASVARFMVKAWIDYEETDRDAPPPTMHQSMANQC